MTDLAAYVLSGFTLANLWLAGNLNRWTWVVGQFLWFWYVVMIRNQFRWIKEGRV